MNEREEELFDLKYLEEISELFSIHKQSDNYYGLDLFKKNYCDFYDFMKYHVIIYENIIDDGSDIDEENNLHYNNNDKI